MKSKKILINAAEISSRTYRAKWSVRQHVKRVSLMLSDKNKSVRIGKGYCMACFYIHHGSIAGAAITHSECGLCDTVDVYNSTDTDVLCIPCSKEHGLCKKCGGELSVIDNEIITSLETFNLTV